MAKIKCTYCGNMIDDMLDVCPVCRNPLAKTADAVGPKFNHEMKYNKENEVPKTIQEFEDLVLANRYPGDAVTHFYIGKNVSTPKAFGICRELDAVIIYLNKADGTRVVKYRGKDESYAVANFYKIYKERVIDKLPDEQKTVVVEKTVEVAPETSAIQKEEPVKVDKTSRLNLQKEVTEETKSSVESKETDDKKKKEKVKKEKQPKEPKQAKESKPEKIKVEREKKTNVLLLILVLVIILGFGVFSALVPVKNDKTLIEMGIELIKGEDDEVVIEEPVEQEIVEEVQENIDLEYLQYYMGDDNALYFYEGYHYDELSGVFVYQWWTFDVENKTWSICKAADEDGIYLDVITKQYPLTLDEVADILGLKTSEIDINRSQKYMDEGQHYPPFAMYYKLNDTIYVYFSDDFLYEKEDETGWYVYNTENGRWDFFRGPNDRSVGNELWYYPQDYVICPLESYDLYADDIGVPSFSETTQYQTYLENKKIFEDYQESIAVNQPSNEATLEENVETTDAPIAEESAVVGEVSVENAEAVNSTVEQTTEATTEVTE